MKVTGNEGVAGRIAISEYSIGYLEHGFARRLGLPMAALQNRAGAFVSPSAASGSVALDSASAPASGPVEVTDADGPDAYPIVTYSWLLLHKQTPMPLRRGASRLRD